MADTANERLHALDAVRGFALIAGIVFHATLSFLPGPKGVPLWITTDSHPSLTLAVTAHVLHIFRMTTFFMIAGFFARLTFHRRGPKGFVADRAKRIAVPLVVGWPIAFAAFIAVTIWAAVSAAHGRPLPPPPAYPGFPAFPLTHLWFLYLLLWFYAATLAIRALIVRLDRSGRLLAGADQLVRVVATHPAGLVALAAPGMLALLVTPQWTPWFGVPTPDSSLVPNLAAAVAYFSAFAFGWLAHRQSEVLVAWRRLWPVNLTLALGFTIAELALIGVTPAILPADRRPADHAGGALSAGLLVLDLRPDRPGAALPVRLQPGPPLHRRRLLLALPGASAAGDGAAGDGRAARVAMAGEVRRHPRRRLPADVRQLPTLCTPLVHRRHPQRTARVAVKSAQAGDCGYLRRLAKRPAVSSTHD